ncbi:NERD domain-containing protein [Streptomyces sp. B-S-A8]|uniref:NERD domain-containing protein n=1 Tax=Streptomyces solicavernae TaxID=3043614 RepID=A0ABT6S2D7_9ACTN|nr:NERD domain-containing protein [Streptomyces sp. B-S-A8]MDI3390158.1 NERD domain-containing protein [Streptomyces sp. B-S-A8]
MSRNVYGTAGRSAQRRADQLRCEELRFQHRRAVRWIVPALVLWYLAAGVIDALLPTGTAWLLAAAAPYVLLKRFYVPGPDVQRWAAGARAERRTGERLERLARRGWPVLLDRSLPRTRANLDALVLLPDGRSAVYIDTKSTRGGGQAALKADTFVLGKSAYPKAIPTVLAEAQAAQQVLGVPVRAVIAVDGAKVPHGQLKHSSGLTVVSSRDLRSLLTAIPHQRDPQSLEALTVRATSGLPPYGDR